MHTLVKAAQSVRSQRPVSTQLLGKVPQVTLDIEYGSVVIVQLLLEQQRVQRGDYFQYLPQTQSAT